MNDKTWRSTEDVHVIGLVKNCRLPASLRKVFGSTSAHIQPVSYKNAFLISSIF
jgi:hypothetical protein